MLPQLTTGNWLFWSIMLWIGLNLFWLRFVESVVPQWVGAIVATLIGLTLFKYGPRPSDQEEEE